MTELIAFEHVVESLAADDAVIMLKKTQQRIVHELRTIRGVYSNAKTDALQSAI